MAQAEAVYSAKQVAQALGISSGMLRRYALAFEEITGETIKQHPRDGRQYDANQLATLQRARAFVTANAGMGVDVAIKLALGASEHEVVAQPSISPQMSPQAFTEALRLSQQPLLEELSAIRQELQALRVESNGRALDRPKEKGDEAHNSTNVGDGVLVRWARRLEQILKRKG